MEKSSTKNTHMRAKTSIPHVVLLKGCNDAIKSLAEYPFAKKATKYISDNVVAKATRKVYGKKIVGWGLQLPIEMVVTVGRPNYAEREFVKMCKKANVPFPVKRVQLKFGPKK
jgi:hypothetical protein